MNHLLEKAQKIKAIVFDVDGVLTDGKIIYDNQQNESKEFNVKDGFILVVIKELGFIRGAITGRNSPVVAHRCEELKLDFHFHGASQKLGPYEEVKQRFGLQDDQIAYMGDDLPDLPILARCGFSACPSDATVAVRARVDWVAERKGGEAALREWVDFILNAQGKMESLVQRHLLETARK